MKWGFILCLVIISNQINAQINAITETGEQVILYNDGTWEYNNPDSLNAPSEEIKLNPSVFSKGSNSTFQVKSSKLNIGVYINPNVWSYKKEINQGPTEYIFSGKSKDMYAMLIAEQVSIPIESLKEIAVQNAMKASPDVQVVKEEYRMVNGIKVLLLQLKGTVRGIKFSYIGYYYSNENGTIQLVAYTSQNLMSTHQKDMEILLNGLVEIK